MVTNTTPHPPWNEHALSDALVEVVATLPRVPLRDVGSTDPGVYLQWWATTRAEVVDVLGPVADGSAVWYVGSASTGLRGRLLRYEQSLAELAAVDVDELRVAVLPCPSAASALFAEALLITRLDPPGNRIGGFGQKRPGARRTGQRSSPLDALFESGRSWTRSATPVDRIRARCQVLTALAQLDPAGPRWPPLVR